MSAIAQTIAAELNVKPQQIEAAITLLDDGATVPFIARYRKEVTGGLDDTQMRNLEERLSYLREMEERRQTILKSIEEQEKLTPELAAAIRAADTKTRLEDLYLPYKPKRRTKGQIAIEAGLEPLARQLFDNPNLDPENLAVEFVNPEQNIADTKTALEGAKYILMERFAEDADLLGLLRERLGKQGVVISVVQKGKAQSGEKFRDYFDYQENFEKIPSHRALAVFRGRAEGVLSLKLDLITADDQRHPCEIIIAQHFNLLSQGRPADAWLSEVVRWTWRVKLHTQLETDLLGQLRGRAEEDAIEVFANNLKDLLLAAPAGPKVTLGLDPGLRTGVKAAVVDATGKVLDYGAIFPHAPQKRIQEAETQIVHWLKTHNVNLIAIGNGTASRETDAFVGQVLKNHPQLSAQKIIVSEAGASVYSASEFAAKEFPDLDVTIRGAISIARRLQDPLAELVKIEPKAIGVGQYQHDLSPVKLTKSLDSVVEDCVNAVGVDVNTASVPLLTRVSGLNSALASNIISFRDQHGAFRSRQALTQVPRFGEKTFEQAAGFLRIHGGENLLDNSAVHPESYTVVEAMADTTNSDISSLLGNKNILKTIDPKHFVTERFGLPTVKDILQELEKPGRDPRPEFKMAKLKEGVEKISDLSEGMILEGTITNVTNFGAFVDIGVHQDGLVHISALANQFVKDPRAVVKAGDIVKVKVMDIDIARKRIALSMRLDDEPNSADQKPEAARNRKQSKPKQQNTKPTKPVATGTMGALLQEALKNKNQPG